MHRVAWIEGTWRDLRMGTRLLRRSPGFATVAVLSLALGIGANTAIFQLIDAVRLRTLPVQKPSELAEVRIVGGNGGFGLNPGAYGQLPRPIWLALRDHQQAFSGMFAWATQERRVGEMSDLQRARGLVVSGDFFRVLGVPAWRGRLFEAADDGLACPATSVVVSYGYWQTHLGGRALDGQTRLRIDNELHEVIGVTPPTFQGLAVGESFDLAVPFCQPSTPLRRDLFELTVMGRLRPDWTIDRASGHLFALSTGLFEENAPSDYSSNAIARFKSFRLGAYPAASGVSVLRTQYDRSLQLLLAITGLVLLLACANLANLMLARASAREREVAVRLALGASRLQLVRQLFAESSVIAVLGAAIGIGLAQALSRVLVWALSTEASAPTLALSADWRVLLFTAVIATATCIVFGIAPALRAARIAPAAAMKTGGRGIATGGGRFSVQRLMVVTQIAVSLVLLVAAFLFVRSFHNLLTFDPGIRTRGITVGFFGFNRLRLEGERTSDFRLALANEIRAVPGILNAASTTNVPLFGGSWGHGVDVDGTSGSSKFTWVGPGYFETVGTPILRGRDFTPRDTASAPRVAIVNEAFVRELVGTGNPIGRHLRTSPEPGYPSTVYEIIGVIPDTQYDNLRGKPPAMAFAPDAQHPMPRQWAAIMIHSSLPPREAIASVKQRMTRAHPEIIIADFTVFESRIRDGLVRERLLAMLSGFFGVLAAVLATVGLYGLIAYGIAQRRQEIGVRIALGARRAHVITMVMRDAGVLLAIGLIVGLGLALAAGRSAATLLFGLQPHDPLTIGGACALLAVIAVAASFIPARRASKLDPLVALRHE